MEYAQTAITIMSIALAGIAWFAKLRWAKEYMAARDAESQAKDAQIQVLRQQVESLHQLTPVQLKEHFDSVKTQLTEYAETLKKQLQKSEKLIKEVTPLKEENANLRNEVGHLRNEREVMLEAIRILHKPVEERQASLQLQDDISKDFRDCFGWGELQRDNAMLRRLVEQTVS